MKLSELMNGITPDPAYEGLSNADDMVLAVDITQAAGTPPGDYAVVQGGITEHSQDMGPQSSPARFIRSVTQNKKTGNAPVITINGQVLHGDEFQDFALSHSTRWGTGSKIRLSYIFFNRLTGKGDKGAGDLIVTSHPTGAAGDPNNFSATLNPEGIPTEYTYEAPTG